MTVQELIERLRTLPQDADVWVRVLDWECSGKVEGNLRHVGSDIGSTDVHGQAVIYMELEDHVTLPAPLFEDGSLK